MLHCTNCCVLGEHHGLKKINKIKSLQAIPLEEQSSNYNSNSKCYKNANITNQTLKPQKFDFFYGITMIFHFFFNLQNDAGNFISLGFHFIS